nr:alpha-ketoglutarate-dependent dioxygenase AlkB [Paraburkholderia aspalathi]
MSKAALPRALSAPVSYTPDFIVDADAAYARLRDELDWERRDSTPRMEYYSNDILVPYAYGEGRGRRSYEPKPWHPVVLAIRDVLTARTKDAYEVCFLNYYADQSQHLGWHSDDDDTMDDARPIAIVSLGVEREIWFRRKDEKGVHEAVTLGHGSLCLMAPGMQDTHDHRIPKAGFECGGRISLTFRGFA